VIETVAKMADLS